MFDFVFFLLIRNNRSCTCLHLSSLPRSIWWWCKRVSLYLLRQQNNCFFPIFSCIFLPSETLVLCVALLLNFFIHRLNFTPTCCCLCAAICFSFYFICSLKSVLYRRYGKDVCHRRATDGSVRQLCWSANRYTTSSNRVMATLFDRTKDAI